MSRIKRGLRNFSLSIAAVAMLSSGCAAVYRQPDYVNRGRANFVENLRKSDNHRAGLDVVPADFGFVGGNFFVSGYLRNGDVVIANEEVDRSNDVLLRNVGREISKIIKLNESSPDRHPKREIYVTGIYDRGYGRDDGLDLETININGDLYFTDPTGRCEFTNGFEFWDQDGWKWFNNVHYPEGFSPWWDHNRRGMFFERHGVVNPYGDWDKDGISNWSESVLGTNMYNYDTDYDGLDDLTELYFGTDPCDSDSDNDGYSDYYDPFPLWHSRYHETPRHSDWSVWWNNNYDNVETRYKTPKSKRIIPGTRWKESKKGRKETIKYRRTLDNQEKKVRINVEKVRKVQQREQKSKTKNPRTKKTR
ncbi:hypothetical protein HN865_05530 [Candidatus Woesearchaeota archaeon]|jgi:hypothetical protein|nr:hypothetical protein [Candidatus Woesearchaeota archaeon]MBT7238279.1 hypothetical protein [Candidatus Woesearchaeota archaeon]